MPVYQLVLSVDEKVLVWVSALAEHCSMVSNVVEVVGGRGEGELC